MSAMAGATAPLRDIDVCECLTARVEGCDLGEDGGVLIGRRHLQLSVQGDLEEAREVAVSDGLGGVRG